MNLIKVNSRGVGLAATLRKLLSKRLTLRRAAVVLSATVFSSLLASSAALAANASAQPQYRNPAQDAFFSQPFIDVDEWREQPVRHRYVHGGFTGTDTRFSLYLPPKEQYQGRFFQYITPVPDSENLSQGASGEEDRIGFALASGAYFIETNGGGKDAAMIPGSRVDPSIGAYRANAAVAAYSRVVANKMYGGKRPYGYAFGGSGGAYRTVASIENTDGVWDGVVPFVMGSPMALPNVFTARVYGLRVLADKLPGIADAVDVGSNRDPYAGLNAEEKAALEEVTRMGFPLRAWHTHSYLGLHAFAVIYPAVVAIDPGYFKDFWTTPGYEGHAMPPSLKAAHIQQPTVISKLITAADAKAMGLDVSPFAGQAKGGADNAWKAVQGEAAATLPVGIQLAAMPTRNTLGADLQIKSGKAAGSVLPMTRLQGDVVLLGAEYAPVLQGLQVGDKVQVDNSNFLAVQTYHRHQVPGPEYSVWDQFRDADGKPLYPQRPLLGPMLSQGATGSLPSGRFTGKMILVENLYDTEAFPWQADWYRARVSEYLGAATNDNFRLWYIDHTNHADTAQQKAPTHTVSYIGALQQALRDLSAWVEQGAEPPATSAYTIADGQVVVPPTAAERRGIQPVVAVTANGGKRAEVAAGKPVLLEAVVEVAVAAPDASDAVVAAAWDLDGSGTYATPADIVSAKVDGKRWVFKITHQFDQAGTYFPTLRVASSRGGNATSPFAQVQNLDRVRVVVK